MKKIGELIGAVLMLLALMWIGSYFDSDPAPAPSRASAMPASNSDCQVTVLDTDGTDGPVIDQNKLCGALSQAEGEAACMGDWQPPTSISARQLCIEVHQRGCGAPNENCDKYPTDQIYHSTH